MTCPGAPAKVDALKRLRSEKQAELDILLPATLDRPFKQIELVMPSGASADCGVSSPARLHFQSR